MTTQLNLQSSWEEVKEKLKEASALLTDDDLVYVPGNETALLQRVADKIGKSTTDVKAWIESVSFNKGQAS